MPLPSAVVDAMGKAFEEEYLEWEWRRDKVSGRYHIMRGDVSVSTMPDMDSADNMIRHLRCRTAMMAAIDVLHEHCYVIASVVD